MREISTPAREDELAHLAALLGSQHVYRERDRLVVSPSDPQQVSELLRFASERKLAVEPAGGGTKQQWGNPVKADMQLSLLRMHAMREHAWQDMICTVQAGTRWADMQRELQKHGQMVALDPLWPDSATVGGIIACNDSGSMRLKYGSLRDVIVGMTVVLADGTVAKSGGKVVKNVAGYDLHKLMTGSFGTLGVIVEANFRLHPVEQHDRTWSIRFPHSVSVNPGDFAEPLRALLNAPITPTSIQLRCDRRQCALDVRVASLPNCLDDCAMQLGQIAGDCEIVESPRDVWMARERLFDQESSVVLKVSVPMSDICDLTAEWMQVSQSELELSSVAQANGLVTVAVNGPTEQMIHWIHRLRDRIGAAGGSVVVQKLPDSLRDSIELWGHTSNPLPLMRSIKQQFDPDRILNPGRFLGGI